MPQGPSGAGRLSSWDGRNPCRQLREATGGNGTPDVLHEGQVEVQVVQRRQPDAEDLVALIEVPQVGTRVAPAGRAAAVRIDRAGVALMHGVADVDDPA